MQLAFIASLVILRRLDQFGQAIRILILNFDIGLVVKIAQLPFAEGSALADRAAVQVRLEARVLRWLLLRIHLGPKGDV